MKKAVLFFIVVAALCLTILIGVSSGKVCPRKSFLCSSFTLAFTANTVLSGIEPVSELRESADRDLIYYREFLSSIFHPPKHLS